MLLGRNQKLILWKILLLLTLLMCVLYQINDVRVIAQSSWSLPQKIPGFSVGIDTMPPFLIADENKTVHAFASEWIGKDSQQLVIVYFTWTLDGGWTKPIDIIISPVKEARIIGVVLDEVGIFHLIFYGGEEPSGDLYYTQAAAFEANQTSAWFTPKLIGKNAIIPNSGAIIDDKHGNLFVLYGGDSNKGRCIYFLKSNDRGEHWSNPDPIFFTSNSPFGIRFVAGDSGFFHAVWYVVDVVGHNLSAHYRRYNPKDEQWGKTNVIAEGYGINEGMGISNIEVIEHKGQVFIMYNNGIPPVGVPPAPWFLLSKDAGQTWDQPYRPFSQHVGRNGIIAFAVDSGGNLHVLFPDRIPINENGIYSAIYGNYHSVWLGDHWGYPESVVDSSQGTDVENGIFGGYDIRAVVVQGNLLLCIWRNDPGLKQIGVWFSYKLLDTPSLPIKLLPTVTRKVQITPSAIINDPQKTTLTPEINPQKTQSPEPVVNNSPDDNLTSGLLIGLIFPFLLIVAVFIYRIRKSYSR